MDAKKYATLLAVVTRRWRGARKTPAPFWPPWSTTWTRRPRRGPAVLHLRLRPFQAAGERQGRRDQPVPAPVREDADLALQPARAAPAHRGAGRSAGQRGAGRLRGRAGRGHAAGRGHRLRAAGGGAAVPAGHAAPPAPQAERHRHRARRGEPAGGRLSPWPRPRRRWGWSWSSIPCTRWWRSWTRKTGGCSARSARRWWCWAPLPCTTCARRRGCAPATTCSAGCGPWSRTPWCCASPAATTTRLRCWSASRRRGTTSASPSASSTGWTWRTARRRP